jgi:hypothetical protein
MYIGIVRLEVALLLDAYSKLKQTLDFTCRVVIRVAVIFTNAR